MSFSIPVVFTFAMFLGIVVPAYSLTIQTTSKANSPPKSQNNSENPSWETEYHSESKNQDTPIKIAVLCDWRLVVVSNFWP